MNRETCRDRSVVAWTLDSVAVGLQKITEARGARAQISPHVAPPVVKMLWMKTFEEQDRNIVPR